MSTKSEYPYGPETPEPNWNQLKKTYPIAPGKARTQPEKPPVPMTFEEAMQHLRRGRSIQRRAWNVNSMIFALGDKVFIKLPNGHEAYGSAPTFWKPYPQDFLASDWRVVK